MCRFKRFSDEDYQKYQGQLLYGRVKSYNRKKGYGWILAENGKDIFVSSYNLRVKERCLNVGAVTKFVPIIFNGRISADEVHLIEKYPYGEKITIPDGSQLRIDEIEKWYYLSGSSTIYHMGITEEEIREKGLSTNQFDCIVIQHKYSGYCYRFFDIESPIQGDGRTNLREYHNRLKNVLWYL